LRFLRASNGQPIEIAPEDEINAGGEARIYSVASGDCLVAKVYRHPKRETERKLKVMLANPPSDPTAAQGHASIAWPLDLLRSEKEGTDAGYLMPRVVGARPVIDLYNPISRRESCPLFSYQYLYRTAHNLAAVMHALHSRNYVIGDVNESNILVTDTALITVVDTDSFQVRDADGKTVFRCPVGKPEFTPAELQGKMLHNVDRTPTHDCFGLAVLIFQLLMEGTHPFAGIYKGEDDPPPFEARITAGHFPHGSKATPYGPLPFAPPLEILPEGIKQLFLRCFEDGYEDPLIRPHASAWVKALREAEQNLIACAVNDQHRYPEHLDACPWCRRTALLGGRDPFPSKERVLSGHHLESIGTPVQTALPSAAAPVGAIAPIAQSAPSVSPGTLRVTENTPPVSPPAAPAPPPASRITFAQRPAAPVKRPRTRWLIPAALLLIAGLAIPWVFHLTNTIGATPAPRKAPSTVLHPIADSDLPLMFTAAHDDISKSDDVKLRVLLTRAPQLAKRTGKDDWTLLHFAAYQGDSTAAQMLLETGGDVNAREKDDFTPLHLAAQEGKTETAAILIDKGADVNAQEGVGWTPLHFAAQEGRAEVAKLLMAHGADPNIREKKGLTPLAVAEKEHKPQLADIIREHGGLP